MPVLSVKRRGCNALAILLRPCLLLSTSTWNVPAVKMQVPQRKAKSHLLEKANALQQAGMTNSTPVKYARHASPVLPVACKDPALLYT